MKIAYICDGLAACSDKVGCYRIGRPGVDCCRHTFQDSHAKNGKCIDPQNHPERFHPIDLSDQETCWWEGEVLAP